VQASALRSAASFDENLQKTNKTELSSKSSGMKSLNPNAEGFTPKGNIDLFKLLTRVEPYIGSLFLRGETVCHASKVAIPEAIKATPSDTIGLGSYIRHHLGHSKEVKASPDEGCGRVLQKTKKGTWPRCGDLARSGIAKLCDVCARETPFQKTLTNVTCESGHCSNKAAWTVSVEADFDEEIEEIVHCDYEVCEPCSRLKTVFARRIVSRARGCLLTCGDVESNPGPETQVTSHQLGLKFSGPHEWTPSLLVAAETGISRLRRQLDGLAVGAYRQAYTWDNVTHEPNFTIMPGVTRSNISQIARTVFEEIDSWSVELQDDPADLSRVFGFLYLSRREIQSAVCNLFRIPRAYRLPLTSFQVDSYSYGGPSRYGFCWTSLLTTEGREHVSSVLRRRYVYGAPSRSALESANVRDFLVPGNFTVRPPIRPGGEYHVELSVYGLPADQALNSIPFNARIAASPRRITRPSYWTITSACVRGTDEICTVGHAISHIFENGPPASSDNGIEWLLNLHEFHQVRVRYQGGRPYFTATGRLFNDPVSRIWQSSEQNRAINIANAARLRSTLEIEALKEQLAQEKALGKCSSPSDHGNVCEDKQHHSEWHELHDHWRTKSNGRPRTIAFNPLSAFKAQETKKREARNALNKHHRVLNLEPVSRPYPEVGEACQEVPNPKLACNHSHLDFASTKECKGSCGHTHEGSDEVAQLPSCATNDSDYYWSQTDLWEAYTMAGFPQDTTVGEDGEFETRHMDRLVRYANETIKARAVVRSSIGIGALPIAQPDPPNMIIPDIPVSEWVFQGQPAPKDGCTVCGALLICPHTGDPDYDAHLVNLRVYPAFDVAEALASEILVRDEQVLSARLPSLGVVGGVCGSMRPQFSVNIRGRKLKMDILGSMIVHAPDLPVDGNEISDILPNGALTGLIDHGGIRAAVRAENHRTQLSEFGLYQLWLQNNGLLNLENKTCTGTTSWFWWNRQTIEDFIRHDLGEDPFLFFLHQQSLTPLTARVPRRGATVYISKHQPRIARNSTMADIETNPGPVQDNRQNEYFGASEKLFPEFDAFRPLYLLGSKWSQNRSLNVPAGFYNCVERYEPYPGVSTYPVLTTVNKLKALFAPVNALLKPGLRVEVCTHFDWQPERADVLLILRPFKERSLSHSVPGKKPYFVIDLPEEVYNDKIGCAQMRFLPLAFGRPDCYYQISNCRNEWYDLPVDLLPYVKKTGHIWSYGHGHNVPLCENVMGIGRSLCPEALLYHHFRNKCSYGADADLITNIGIYNLVTYKAVTYNGKWNAPRILGAKCDIIDVMEGTLTMFKRTKLDESFWARYSSTKYRTSEDEPIGTLASTEPLYEEIKITERRHTVWDRVKDKFSLNLFKRLDSYLSQIPDAPKNCVPGRLTISHEPELNDVVKHTTLLIAVMGTKGDLNPMLWIAKRLVEFGVNVHVWHTLLTQEEMVSLREGRFGPLAIKWARVMGCGCMGYKATFTPLLRSFGPGASYSLGMGPKYTERFKPVPGPLGTLASFWFQLMGQDYLLSPYAGGNLPFSPDGERLILDPEKVTQKGSLDESWYMGSTDGATIPDHIKSTWKQIEYLDPIMELPRLKGLAFPGSASTMKCIAGTVPHDKIFVTEVMLDRIYRHDEDGNMILPLACEFRDRPLLPLLVQVESFGFRIPLTIKDRGLALVQTFLHFRTVDLAGPLYWLVRYLGLAVVLYQKFLPTILLLLSIPGLMYLVLVLHMQSPFLDRVLRVLTQFPVVLFFGWKSIPLVALWVMSNVERGLWEEFFYLNNPTTRLFFQPTQGMPFPFCHVGLYSPKYDEVIQGTLLPRHSDGQVLVKRGQPFTVTIMRGLPPPGSWAIPVPINFGLVREMVPNFKTAGYSSRWNCQSVMLDLLQHKGAITRFIIYSTIYFVLLVFGGAEFAYDALTFCGVKVGTKNITEYFELSARGGVAATVPAAQINQHVESHSDTVLTELIPELQVDADYFSGAKWYPPVLADIPFQFTPKHEADRVRHELRKILESKEQPGLKPPGEKAFLEDILRQYAWLVNAAHQTGVLDQSSAMQIALDDLSEKLLLIEHREVEVPTLKGYHILKTGRKARRRVTALINKALNLVPPGPIADILKWLRDHSSELAEFAESTVALVLDLGWVTFKIFKEAAKVITEILHVLLDIYFPGEKAYRTKTVWALSNLFEREPYLSARMRLISSLVKNSPEARTTPEEDYEKWVADIKRHGAKMGAGHVDEIGGVQYKPVLTGKPVLSPDQAALLGYKEGEYTSDPMWNAFVANLRGEGVPIGADGVLWAEHREPDALLRSLDRYNKPHPLPSEEDSSRMKAMANALYDKFPDRFGLQVSSTEGVIKYMKDDLRPGPPFLNVYKTRREMFADGWDKAIRSYIHEQLTTGTTPVGFHYGFIKNQVVNLEKVKAGKNVRGVLSNAPIQQIRDLMFQGMMSKNYDWRSTGFGMGMPSNHQMVSLFEKVANHIDPVVNPASKGGSILLSDCTEYDSTTTKLTYDGLIQIVRRAAASLPNSDAITSVVAARYHQLANHGSWILSLTRQREEGQNTWLPKELGGGTGEATTTWTNTVGYRLNQLMAIDRATDYKSSPEEILRAFCGGNTGDDQLASLAGWFIEKYDLGEPDPRHPGCYRLNKEGFTKLTEASAAHGLKVEYETCQDIEDATYLSKRVRIPNARDLEDLEIWAQEIFNSTGIRPPIPHMIGYHDVSAMNLRRQALPYNKSHGPARSLVSDLNPRLRADFPIYQRSTTLGASQPGRPKFTEVPAWVLGKVQQTMGHMSLLAFNPDYYTNVALEHIAWFNRCAEIGGLLPWNTETHGEKLPIAVLEHDRFNRPYVWYRPIELPSSAPRRQAALRDTLIKNQAPTYHRLITVYMREPKESQSHVGIKSKVVQKFQHFFDTPTERTAGFVEALTALYQAIPKEATKYLPSIPTKYSEPNWHTEGMILEVASMRILEIDSLPELSAASKEGPYAVCTALGAAWSRRHNDPAWWDRMESIPVEAFKNYQLTVTLMYALLYGLEFMIYATPWIGVIYRVIMFFFINFTKTYVLLNIIYWHDTNRSSRPISALVPRDIYQWSKRFANWLTWQLWKYLGPTFFVYLPFYLFPGMISRPAEAVAKWLLYGRNAATAEPGLPGQGQPENPWNRVVEAVLPMAANGVNTNPSGHSQMVGIPAPTGTGKSSFFVVAIYNYILQHPAAYNETKIWLCVPRRILRDGFSVPFPEVMDRSKKLRKGESLIDATGNVATIRVGTYKHLVHRFKSGEFTDGDIILFDEAGERDGAMIELLSEVRSKHKASQIYHMTATPIPLKAFPEPENQIIQYDLTNIITPRFTVEDIIWDDDPIGRWQRMSDETPLSADESEDHVKMRVTAATVRPMFIYGSVRSAKLAVSCLQESHRLNPILVTREEVKQGRITSANLKAANCIVGSQILSRGFDDVVGATSVFSENTMIAQHRGALRTQLSSKSEHIQRKGRAGRKMNGINVIQPGAGTGPEPESYPSASTFANHHVAIEFGVPQLQTPTNPISSTMPYVGVNDEIQQKVTSVVKPDPTGQKARALLRSIALLHLFTLEGIDQKDWPTFYADLYRGKRLDEDYEGITQFAMEGQRGSADFTMFAYPYVLHALNTTPLVYKIDGKGEFESLPLRPLDGDWRTQNEIQTKIRAQRANPRHLSQVELMSVSQHAIQQLELTHRAVDATIHMSFKKIAKTEDGQRKLAKLQNKINKQFAIALENIADERLDVSNLPTVISDDGGAGVQSIIRDYPTEQYVDSVPEVVPYRVVG